MNWKKIGRAILYPPLAIMILLLPTAAVFLVYAMVFLGTDSLTAILSYVLAAYTLTVWCLRIPQLIRLGMTFREENPYARRWREDIRLRMNTSLYGSLLWNTAYALLQLGMGFRHHSFWFYSLAGYYLSLSVMRFFLVRYTRRYNPGEQLREELRRYRACGAILLVMNLALALMIFFMVYWNRTFHHHEITAIALAAYTFTALTRAIIHIRKCRFIGSPVYSASTAIRLAAACVSMLTLESTMLTTFGDGSMDLAVRRILLGVSGGVVSVMIIAMALYMIVQGTKKMRLLPAAKEDSHGAKR